MRGNILESFGMTFCGLAQSPAQYLPDCSLGRESWQLAYLDMLQSCRNLPSTNEKCVM